MTLTSVRDLQWPEHQCDDNYMHSLEHIQRKEERGDEKKYGKFNLTRTKSVYVVGLLVVCVRASPLKRVKSVSYFLFLFLEYHHHSIAACALNSIHLTRPKGTIESNVGPVNYWRVPRK